MIDKTLKSLQKNNIAFRYNCGLFQFKILPFGLTDAPSSFQRAMDMIFKDTIGDRLQVYMDDVIIYSHSYEDCLLKLKRTMLILRAVSLTINLTKCQFMHNHLKYLGQIIGNGSLQPDRKRIEALYKMKEPKTVTDVRALIGFLKYWQ